MSEDKKVWFHRVNARIWLPISWEGWAMLLGFVGGFFLIPYLNGLSRNESIVFARDWPVLLEMGVLVVAFYWLSSGRVRK